MSDSGASFFNANKATRGEAFQFPNSTGEDAERAGEQASRLHPTPAMLGNGQKVGNGDGEPSPPLTGNTGRTPGEPTVAIDNH